MSTYDFNKLIDDLDASFDVECITHGNRPWFSTSDCIDAYTNFTKQEAALWLLRLPGRDKIRIELPDEGRVFFGLSEVAIDQLMVQADHPFTEPFKEWVFRDVMPKLGPRPTPDTINWLIDMFAELLDIRPGSPFDSRDAAFDIALSTSTLTSVVLRSAKPTARAFQDWVFGEALVAIRRTGKYLCPRNMDAIDGALSTALRDHAEELKTFVSDLTPGDLAEAPMSWRLIPEEDLLS